MSKPSRPADTVNNTANKQPGDYDFNVFSDDLVNGTNISHARNTLVSREHIELLDFITLSVSVPFLSVVGLFGNGMSIWVLYQHRLHDPMYSYLCVLSVADWLTLLVAFGMSIIRTIHHFDPVLSDMLATNMKSVVGTFSWIPFVRTARLIIMVMSIVRVVATCLPMKMKTFKKHKLVVILSTSIAFILSVALWIPQTFIFETKSTFDPSLNRTIFRLYHTPWASEHIGSLETLIISSTVIMDFIPSVCIFIFNGVIIVVTAVKTCRRMELSSDDRKILRDQLKLTVTLLTLSTCVVLGQAPSMVVFVLGMPNPKVEPNFYQLLGSVNTLLTVFNSANNFVVFSLLPISYRKTWCSLLCCRCTSTDIA